MKYFRITVIIIGIFFFTLGMISFIFSRRLVYQCTLCQQNVCASSLKEEQYSSALEALQDAKQQLCYQIHVEQEKNVCFSLPIHQFRQSCSTESKWRFPYLPTR